MHEKHYEFNKENSVSFTTELANLLHENLKKIGIKSDPDSLFCNLYDQKYSEKLDDLIALIIEDLA